MYSFLRKLKLLFTEDIIDVQNRIKLTNDILRLRAEIHAQDRELYDARAKATFLSRKSIPIAGFDELYPEPFDPKERRKYAANVAEFHEEVLKTKIRMSVGEIRGLLANVGAMPGFSEGFPTGVVTRDQYDFFLRGMEAGLWKINDWAESLSAELKEN